MGCGKASWTTTLLAVFLASGTARANNFGESTGWQFQTAADKANLAVVADLIAKRKSGYYAAPTYTTTIDRQYNCNVSASALGNSGSNSTVANSPATSGATSTATGNASTTSIDGYGAAVAPASSGIDGTQANTGAVRSSVVGPTQTTVSGSTSTQALNSAQNNTGAQTASAGGSTGCAFGALN